MATISGTIGKAAIVTVTIKAVNAVTGAAIAQPRIFLNGRAAQNPILVYSDTSVSVAVSAEGYQSATQNRLYTSSGDVLFPLTPQTQAATLTLQFVPGTVVDWTLTGVGGTFSGESEDNGVATVSLPPGSYALAGNAIGFANVTQTLTVSNTQTITISLLPTAGNSSTATGAPPEEGLPYDEELDTQALVDDPSESIYDNSAYQGYFTAAQVRLYLGDLFLDELVSLQYARQDNRLPVYGYCSRYYDAMAEGRSLVQGQIVINFVHRGYLQAALRNQQRQSQVSDPASAHARKIARALKASGDPQLDAGSRQQASKRLNQLLSASTAADAALARKLLRPASSDPFDSHPMANLAPFDLRLEIGDGSYQSVRRLEGVVLTGNEQIHDARSGEVTGENYTFVARRLL